MRKAVRCAIFASLLMTALGWGGAMVSAQDKEAIVKDRQAAMKAQAAALAGIKKYLDGDADQAAGKKSADDLVTIAQSLPDKFPSDTGNAEVPSSHAKPIIWTENDKFLAAQKNLVVQTEKLAAAVASGDKKAAVAQFAATGREGCAGCHSTYRLPLN